MSPALLMPLLLISFSGATARRVADRSIQVDGDGGERAWQPIPFSGDFVQYAPREGAPASEQTRVKAAYDGSAVYFFVEALDSRPDAIIGRLTRRDETSGSDWIHIWLDTFDDDRSAYRFSVNPAGVKQDARITDEQEDVSWNAVWEARTRTSTAGWSAEIRIPFSQLRYDSGAGSWGFQVGRDLSRKNERSQLSSTPRGSTRPVRYFGTLSGLDALPESWALSLEPYATAGVSLGDADPDLAGNLGLEARLGLGSSLTMSLTVNPDFGQVEADPSVLNLGATELFFDERRDFFLEGREILDFPLGFGDGDAGRYTLFYTRRLGRAPPGSGNLRDGEEIVDAPARTRILGAARLTGKTADGWSIGLLDAVTGDARAKVVGPGGAEQRRVVDPLANAAVARVSKDFRGGRTTTGLMATHLIRRADADTEREMVTQAMSGGADLSHRMGDYQILGKVYGTHLAGTPEAIDAVQRSSVHYFQRPDAKHLSLDPERESLSGWGLTLVGGKTTGKHWRAAAGGMITSPGLDPNPLGYLPRADEQLGFLWVQYRDDEPGPAHRAWQLNTNAWLGKTFGDEITAAGGNVNATWELPDRSYLYAGVGRNLETLDPTSLFGGPAILRPGRWFGWLGGETDDRAVLGFGGEGEWSYADDGGGARLGLRLTAKVRPTSSVEVSLEPAVQRTIEDAQFIEEREAPIIGHLEQTTVQLAARANWTITPELSLQLYASPFLTGGTYTDFRAVIEPRASEYPRRFRAAEAPGGDRFVFAQLRSNLVVRWEYMLGSTLFLVWSHEQSLNEDTRGTIDLDRDLGALFAAQTNDTVMLKLTHWLAI